MPHILLKREPSLHSKLSAFAFQKEAVNAVRDNEYAAIFHEQGLGKTKIAIDLLLYWLDHHVVDTVLVVVKKSLVGNWQRELGVHSYMKPRILTQDRSSNFFVFNSPSRLILVHYEAVKTELKRFELFLRTREVGVILDESTKIKNPESALTKTFFILSPFFKRRVILTGTPIANRPYDIWSQIYFLDHGASLGRSFAEFKKTSELSNELADNATKRSVFETTLEVLYKKINSFTVRKTKTDGLVTLPDKVYQSVECDWEPRQLQMYVEIQKDLRTVITKDGIPQIDSSEDELKRLLRLVQVASNPALVDPAYDKQPGKLEYLGDLIEKIVAREERCIVWSSFVENTNWLHRTFRSYGSLRLNGKMSIADRNATVDRFLTDSDSRVLIATPQAAREGLTLTVANHVIFYDRSFALDDYLQAQDRIHRISQQKTCYVYNLIIRDSIDEWVDLLLSGKQLAAQLAQGDITLEQYHHRMSYDFGNVIKEILNGPR